MKIITNVQRGFDNRMVERSDLMYLSDERYSIYIRNCYNG
jgi:hypothetical protein